MLPVNNKLFTLCNMNIVQRAIDICGSQQKLANELKRITGHPYLQSHVCYWVRRGHFPADLADTVSAGIFRGELTPLQVCPKIKRPLGQQAKWTGRP